MPRHPMREIPIFVTDRLAARNPVSKARQMVGLVRESGSVYFTSKPITSAEMVVRQMWDLMQDLAQEAFYIIVLDEGKRVIGVHLAGLGTLTNTLVHPREVFKVPIALNAPYIITVHNHPSGNPTPSKMDRDLDYRLIDVGHILGVEVLDNIIVGEEGFTSRESGYTRRDFEQ